ncbi:MAG: hypothetical protein JNK63_00390 [Chthonomonas sp.]|nr:hypothetical protein [Chthonomonas sp.]
MRIFLCAGEASGDAYAGALAEQLAPDFEIEGVGGSQLRKAGARMVADSRRWGALGLIETLKVAPLVLGGFRAAKKNLRQGTPGVFVPIDYGYINVRLARTAKRHGWKVLYFIPPGSWRRDKQGADLPLITDKIVTPFPWSAKILRDMGADAEFFGHPVLQMIESDGVDIQRSEDEVAILPGSRQHEIIHNLPPIVAAVKALGVKKVAFGVASTITSEELSRLWLQAGGNGIEADFNTDRHQVLRRCRAGVICSGTATLEAAMCGLPHVVVYRGSRAMVIEAKIRKPQFEYISLPNLILQQPILTELIQWDATAERIKQELGKIMDDGGPRRRQLDAFARLQSDLEPRDCLNRTAQLIRELATSK